MANLKMLEYKYSKNYNEVFEDIATLMFCIDLGLSRGVNRRINQRAIESDPVLINGKSYAYQAKYYEESTKLSQHKKDLLESIKGALEENVTDLYLFISKNKPDKDHKIGEEPQYIQEIEDTAKDCNITLHWWTKSMIETSLDLEPFRYVKEMYFRSADDDKPDYSEFYEYVYEQFAEKPKSKLFGDISLQQSYIEPFIDVNGTRQTVHEYLESWVDGEEKVAIISGEPGHGKTSLCHKAMCDFYKNGWLAGKVSNVFCFSLNPAMTDAIENESFNLYSLLSWGNNRKSQKHILDENDCKNALIFLDGFDELIEWYPKFNLKYFIVSEIVPFQEETGAHIVITSRNMAVDPDAVYYSLQGGTSIPIWRLQLITEQQQLRWIGQYIEYCRKSSAQKAKDLKDYLNSYKELEERADLKEILGIPIIFRLIVDAQYLPTTEKSITQIYDRLFHVTWIRHRRRQGTEDDETRTKRALQNHALRIFVDNNDTAETSISSESSWLFSFYTTHNGKKRVGFLHRTFYQYFLAHEISRWYREAAGDSEKLIVELKENLSYLARRRLDRTTLSYIKELFEQSEDRERITKAFDKSYSILKKTDGFIQGPSDEMHINIERSTTPLERANNTFWNIVSIGSICGRAVTREHVNHMALKQYDLRSSILRNANFSSVDLSRIDFNGADLSGANLSHTSLHCANLSCANLIGADLSEADLFGAALVETNLRGVNLSGANLLRARLIKADFLGANLCGAKLREANLGIAHLNGLNLSGIDFCRADLLATSFVKTNLSGANFYGSNLFGADFTEADLSGADFCEAIIDSQNASKLKSRGYDVSKMKVVENLKQIRY